MLSSIIHIKSFIVLVCVFLSFYNSSYSQVFGGGVGTEEDPFQIWNTEQWENFAALYRVEDVTAYNNLAGKHIRLMADLDSINSNIYTFRTLSTSRKFSSYFHGGGHKIDVSNSIQFLSNPPGWRSYSKALFLECDNFIIDSITLVGSTKGTLVSIVNFAKNGVISNCTSDYDIGHLTIDLEDGLLFGFMASSPYLNNVEIVSCTNKSSAKINVSSTYPDNLVILAGIASSKAERECSIINCKNYGNLKLMGYTGQNRILAGIYAGYCQYYYDTIVIKNCANYGVLQACGAVCGIVGDRRSNPRKIFRIENCVNVGDLILDTLCTDNIATSDSLFNSVHAIGNIFSRIDRQSYFNNCLNLGNIYAYGQGLNQVTSFISIDSAFSPREYPVISNCLNVGRFHGKHNHLFANVSNIGHNITTFSYEVDTTCLRNNLYDKQMSPYTTGLDGFNCNNRIESWLSSDIVGDSPTLRTYLGNGWSYAPNRYPVPLGFENDSIVLLHANPIFLYSENDAIYNHVDSITNHFNLITSTTTAQGHFLPISWLSTDGHISINAESARLLSVGEDFLVSRLGYYDRRVKIRVVDIPSQLLSPSNEKFTIYPNPAIDILNIETSNVFNNSLLSISISDIQGKIIYLSNFEFTKTLYNIDVSNLTNGLYVISIKSDNEVFNKLFSVMR